MVLIYLGIFCGIVAFSIAFAVALDSRDDYPLFLRIISVFAIIGTIVCLMFGILIQQNKGYKWGNIHGQRGWYYYEIDSNEVFNDLDSYKRKGE